MNLASATMTLKANGFYLAKGQDNCGETVWELRRSNGKIRASWYTRRGLLEWAMKALKERVL
jgi:hypothetical protein